MRIGLFPGQEEALRNELNRLHLLGRRRFLYLGIGVLAGGGAGLLIGTRTGLRRPESGHRVVTDRELAIAIDSAGGSHEVLRRNAALVIAKAYEYPADPVLHAGLIRLTDIIVSEGPSEERRFLASMLRQALLRSPSFSRMRDTALGRRLEEAARER